MIDQALLDALRVHLQHLRQPIVLTAQLDETDMSAQMWKMLEDINGVSDKISILKNKTPDDLIPAPSFSISNRGEPPRVRFAGVPLGHEFTSLVLALLHVSGHPPREEDFLLGQAKSLSKPLHFETFYSLSCQNCPEVVQALNILAALNPNVTHTAIDGAAFPDEVNKRDIMAVPSVYLNGELFAQGRMGLADVLSKIAPAPIPPISSNQQEPYDVLIVGGGPAGASAALYAARKGIKTAIVAERFGGQVLDTAAIENLPSVARTDGTHLAKDLRTQILSYGVELLEGSAITHFEKQSQNGQEEFLVTRADGLVLKSKTLILAPGAKWRELGVPGEQEYKNRGVAYCPHCDGPLFKDKSVAVIGGGNSGVEAAIDLAGLAHSVTLIEYAPSLRADAVLQNKLKSLPNAKIITNAQTIEITGDKKRVNGLVYQQRDEGRSHVLTLDGVFIQIGLVPQTKWLRDLVDLNSFAEIK